MVNNIFLLTLYYNDISSRSDVLQHNCQEIIFIHFVLLFISFLV